ncbi:GyrI-like domain-containing protein [Variovorax sp. LARHSF232]
MTARPHPDSATQRPVRYLELLARAAAHVDANLDAPLDAQMLAQRAAMSRHHFHRIFHAYFGLTVSGYLSWRRLRRACELLGLQQREPVLEVAQAVGFSSAQALAKAMRRELDTTPTAVRAGFSPDWDAFFKRRGIPDDAPGPDDSPPPLQPQWSEAPAFAALCAAGRGMRGGTMGQAAAQAFGELWPALHAAGLAAQVSHSMACMPEEPQGPEDPDCRIFAGVLFGLSLPEWRGTPSQPAIALHGSLKWLHWPAGRYAVFTHIGPYTGLHTMWKAIYRHWLPATGYRLRDVPGFDLYLNDPRDTPPELLRTDLYLPLE